MKNSLHFFYDEIRACCTNVSGPIFYQNYQGEKIDWNKVFETRKNIFKEIKSFFNKAERPNCCIDCCDAPHFMNKNKLELKL